MIRVESGVAVGVLDHGGAVDLSQPDAAGAGADLGVAADPAYRDGAGAGAHVQAAGLVEIDAADRGLDPDLAQTAGAVEGRDRGVAVQAGAGWQLDRDVHRARLAEQAEAALARCPDQQAGGGALDPGQPGVADVRLAGLVAWPDLDDGVVAVGGDDAHVADRQLDGDGDRVGGGEGGDDGGDVACIRF